MGPLVRTAMLLLVAVAAAGKIPESLKACFPNQVKARLPRAVTDEATVKAVIAEKLEYLGAVPTGQQVFHIGEDKTTHEVCAVEVADTANASPIRDGSKMLEAVAGVRGFPKVVIPAASKKIDRTFYTFYATSMPGPNLLSLLAAGLVTLQQAQRWLYQLTHAITELHTKHEPVKNDDKNKNARKNHFIYNGRFLYNLYLNPETQSEIHLRPDNLPIAIAGDSYKLKDYDALCQFVRFVLGYWMEEQTKARFPNGVADMKKELAQVFPETKPSERLGAFQKGFLKLLTEGYGGKTAWFIGWDASDKSNLSSWTPQTPIPQIKPSCGLETAFASS